MKVEDVSQSEWAAILSGVKERDDARAATDDGHPPYIGDAMKIVGTENVPGYWTSEDVMRRFAEEHGGALPYGPPECEHARRVWRPLEHFDTTPKPDGSWNTRWLFEGICPDCGSVSEIIFGAECVPKEGA